MITEYNGKPIGEMTMGEIRTIIDSVNQDYYTDSEDSRRRNATMAPVLAAVLDRVFSKLFNKELPYGNRT